MFFFMMMIMVIVITRTSHMRRRRLRHWHGYYYHRLPPHARPRVEKPQPNAFERLKMRYVQGELSDEEYEAAVDELLRTPEGRLV